MRNKKKDDSTIIHGSHYIVLIILFLFDLNFHYIIDLIFSIISTALLASASTPATATKNNPNGVTVAANYNNNTTATAAAANSSTAAYRCFDAYRRGDVYSYSLVMWEVLSRTLISDANNSNTNDTAVSQPPPQQQEDQPQLEETQQPSVAHQLQQQSSNNGYDPYVYRAPYQDRAVGWDPGFDDMRRVVCSDDPVLSRPGIATEWLADSVSILICKYEGIAL